MSYGSSSSNKYITTYYRRSFSVSDPSAYSALTVRLQRDDGGVVYLNGTEVFRSNMPSGAIDFQTEAASSVRDEDAFVEASVDAGLLRAGTNVVAVEIHQHGTRSSDTSFDLELLAKSAASPAPTTGG